MAREARWSIAIDTGGTFTDACGVSPAGQQRQIKVLSSGKLRAQVKAVDALNAGAVRLTIDRDFAVASGCLVGFRVEGSSASGSVIQWDAASRLLSVDEITGSFHAGDCIDLTTGEEVPLVAARLLTGTDGSSPLPDISLRLATTRGTNALLEGKGVPPVMVLTEGFTDLLEIGDQRRPDLFALRHEKRRLPLGRVIGTSARIATDGAELRPLDRQALVEALDEIPSHERSTAAVALINSFRNPTHERAVEALLKEAGFRHVSISSSLSPAMRVLPRAQTAATDAYLAPVMDQFVSAVREGLGKSSDLLLMTSAGGLEPATEFHAKDSLLSGPAGGLVGALAAARACEVGDIITFDMGGTSTDVARIGGGHLPYRFEQRVGEATVMSPSLRIDRFESELNDARARLNAARAARRDAQAAAGRRGQAGQRSFPAVGSARARRSEAQLNLRRTVVRAPVSGTVSQVERLQVGQVAAPGNTVVTIVANNETWIEANFKETDLDRMHVGQPARVTFDAYPGMALAGRVESIGAGTGSEFSILPPQNATGNWVKVTQRVPVRIRIDGTPSRPLIAGISANVRVTVEDDDER